MGTLFVIQLYATNGAAADLAADAAFARIAELEDVMSDYQADSELMRLCDQPAGKPVRVSTDLFRVLAVSQKFAKASDGAFDVTVGPFVRLWRFSRKRKTLPSQEELARARAGVGWRKLRLDGNHRTVTLTVPGMRLDLGGIGKGYAADAALKALTDRGCPRAMVAGSGDIAIGEPPPGKKGWRVAISGLPNSAKLTEKFLLLQHAGVSTSGDAEQFVEIGGVRYSHIVNPKTGLGVTESVQDTVIGPNATTTDALDTTLNVLGVKRGIKLADSLPGVAALMLDKKTGAITESRRWNRLSR